MPYSLLTAASPEIDFARQMSDLAWSYRASRVVQVAHNLGIFQRIGTASATSAGIAGDLKLRGDKVEQLLIVCAAMELVRRQDGGWSLTDKARATLLPDSPVYQGDVIAHMAGVWNFWNNLEHAVKGEQGAAVWTPGAPAGRSHDDFILAMHGLATAGRAADFATRVDLAGCTRLLDVGGGPASYSIALCQKYPQLRSTIFDLPETLVHTRKMIGRFGLSDRIDTRAGNWDKDDFGRDYDALLFGNVLHGPNDAAPMKLGKAKAALNHGGRLLVVDFLMNAEKTGPLRPALFNIMVGAFSVPEMIHELSAAGFADFGHQALPEDFGTTLFTARRP